MSSTNIVFSDDESLDYLFEESSPENTVFSLNNTTSKTSNSSNDNDDLTLEEIDLIDEICEEMMEKHKKIETTNVSNSLNNIDEGSIDSSFGFDIDSIAPGGEYYELANELNELDFDQALAFLDNMEAENTASNFQNQNQTRFEESSILPANENSLIQSDEELQYIINNLGIEANFNNNDYTNNETNSQPPVSVQMSQLEVVPQNVVSAEITAAFVVFEEVTAVDVVKQNLTQEIIKVKTQKASNKRIMPVFTSLSYQRADRYWEVICSQKAFQIAAADESKIMHSIGGVFIDKESIKRNVVASLLPNYIEVNEFAKYEGKDGWKYKLNKRRAFDDFISLRWCGQKQDFYQPLVIRYKPNGTKKPITQNLCPYCPYTSGMDLNTIFHNVDDSSYMHHVCKDHGVYTTGEEMPIPVFGKTSKGVVAACTLCEHSCNLSIGFYSDNLKNCLISYFRHCFTKHKSKRQNRSYADIRRAEQEKKSNKNYLIMEDL